MKKEISNREKKDKVLSAQTKSPEEDYPAAEKILERVQFIGDNYSFVQKEIQDLLVRAKESEGMVLSYKEQIQKLKAKANDNQSYTRGVIDECQSLKTIVFTLESQLEKALASNKNLVNIELEIRRQLNLQLKKFEVAKNKSNKIEQENEKIKTLLNDSSQRAEYLKGNLFQLKNRWVKEKKKWGNSEKHLKRKWEEVHNSLKAKIDELSNSYEKIEVENNTLRKDLESEKSGNLHLKSVLAARKVVLDQKDESIQNLEVEIKKLISSRDEIIRSRSRESLRKIEKLQDACIHFRKELSKKSSNFDQLEKKYNLLKHEHKTEPEIRAKRLGQDLEVLQRQLAKKEKSIESLSRYELLQETHIAKIKNLETEKVELQTSCKSLEERLSETRRELSELSWELENSKRQRVQDVASITKIRRDLEAQEQKNILLLNSIDLNKKEFETNKETIVAELYEANLANKRLSLENEHLSEVKLNQKNEIENLLDSIVLIKKENEALSSEQSEKIEKLKGKSIIFAEQLANETKLSNIEDQRKISELQKKIKSAEIIINKNEKEKSILDERFLSLSQKYENETALFEESEFDNREAIRMLERSNAALRSSLEKEILKTNDLGAKIDELVGSKLLAVETLQSQLFEEREASQDAREVLKKQIDSLKLELNYEKSELSCRNEKLNSTLESERREFFKSIEGIRDQSEERQSQLVKKYSDEIENLKNENDKLQKEIVEVQRARDSEKLKLQLEQQASRGQLEEKHNNKEAAILEKFAEEKEHLISERALLKESLEKKIFCLKEEFLAERASIEKFWRDDKEKALELHKKQQEQVTNKNLQTVEELEAKYRNEKSDFESKISQLKEELFVSERSASIARVSEKEKLEKIHSDEIESLQQEFMKKVSEARAVANQEKLRFDSQLEAEKNKFEVRLAVELEKENSKKSDEIERIVSQYKAENENLKLKTEEQNKRITDLEEIKRFDDGYEQSLKIMENEMVDKRRELKLRESQISGYSRIVDEQKFKLRQFADELAGEVKSLQVLNPMRNFLNLTKKELQELELLLSKTPALAAERKPLEENFEKLVSQRNQFQKTLDESQVLLVEKAKKVREICRRAVLIPLPPLPPTEDNDSSASV